MVIIRIILYVTNAAKEVTGCELQLNNTLSARFFSSDTPYSLPLVSRTIIEQLVSDRHIREQVLGENIARLLHENNKFLREL